MNCNELPQLYNVSSSFNGDAYCAAVSECVEKGSIEQNEMSIWTIFGYGFIAVTIINLSSIGGLMVVPLMNKRAYSRVLLFFIAMAASALLANALFHLIPQALGLTGAASEKYDETMVIIFAGFYGFYVVGKILDMSLIKCCTKRNEENDATLLQHGHSHGANNVPRPSLQYDEIKESDSKSNSGLFDGLGKIKTIAWLLTIGDGLHNFLDGLAIGTAFNQSLDRGIIISVAIACEEFPHELGDFAVLLKSGMTTKQAVFFNFLSAFFCYLGLIVGTIIGQEPEAARVIIAITAGVFLYISLAGMLPEMEDQMKSSELKLNPFQSFLISAAGLLIGACILKTLSLMLPQ